MKVHMVLITYQAVKQFFQSLIFVTVLVCIHCQFILIAKILIANCPIARILIAKSTIAQILTAKSNNCQNTDCRNTDCQNTDCLNTGESYFGLCTCSQFVTNIENG